MNGDYQDRCREIENTVRVQAEMINEPSRRSPRRSTGWCSADRAGLMTGYSRPKSVYALGILWSPLFPKGDTP